MVKKKISMSQTVYLMIILVLSTADIFIPSIVARQAGRDAWLSVMIATVLSILLSFIWISLTSRFPNESLPEYLPKIFGQTFGGFIALSYIFFFITSIAVIGREFSALMATAFLPFTPIVVLITVIVALSVYAAFEDIEVIARTNEALFPLGMFLLVMVILLTAKDMDFSNLLPILENGLKPPLLGAITLVSYMGETFLILYIYPYICNKETFKRSFILSLVLLESTFLLGTATVALFGIDLTANLMIPTLAMVQVINLANFIQRLDAVIMSIWVGGIFIKLSVYFYFSALSISTILKMRSYKPFLVPLAGIAIPVSILAFEDITEVTVFLEKILPLYLLSWEVLLPSIILIAAVIKKPYEQRK